GAVEIWVFDSRRPWNLSNVFGAQSQPFSESEGQRTSKAEGIDRGMIQQSYRPGRGGVIVFDDGDIEEELAAEREAYCALAEMPELGDDDEYDGSDSEPETENDRIPDSAQAPRKRNSPDFDDSESEPDEGTPRKRQKSNSSSPLPAIPQR